MRAPVFTVLCILNTLTACATVQEPPGGPPDTTPPAIVSTRPDSGAIMPGWRDAAVIQFNEVIDERSGGGLDRLVSLSPVPKQLDVSWKRTAIAVKPKDGWRDSVVYQLTLAPGITDLRTNRQLHGRTIVFTTGGPIPTTRVAGTVVDWEAGRIATKALVEAIRLPDSLTYLSSTDSLGDFLLSALPAGRYRLRAGVDANNNRRIELRESLDTTTVQLDSIITHTFWTFRHDTIGPQLSRVLPVDSVTLRLEFNQVLPPEPPPSGAVSVLALPDSTPVAIANIWRQATFDSLTAAQKPAARRGADTARVDTTALSDTTGRAARPGPPPPVQPGQRLAADTSRAQAAPPDTGRAARLLAERPKLGNVLVVRLEAPVARGGRYVVVGDVRNLVGARAVSRSLLILPPRAAPKP